MINIYSLYDKKLITNITNVCETVQISGDINQVARKLDVTILYPMYDNNLPRTQIGPGNVIWVVDDVEGEIFRGIVFDRELAGDNHLTFTAYDFLVYFIKSKSSYNFTKITPEAITSKICNDAGVSAGEIASTGIPINLISQGSTFYEHIMKAYTQASKQNNKKYIPIMNITKLNVIEKGQLIPNFILSTDTNIELGTYTDTIGNMINKIRVEDDKGNLVTYFENNNWIDTYGLLQDIYTVEQDKDYKTVAPNLLHGSDNYMKINAIGNIKCKTGYAVNVLIPWLSLTQDTAKMYIDGDIHTWDMANGKYEMELTLNFSNQMDFKE